MNAFYYIFVAVIGTVQEVSWPITRELFLTLVSALFCLAVGLGIAHLCGIITIRIERPK